MFWGALEDGGLEGVLQLLRGGPWGGMVGPRAGGMSIFRADLQVLTSF